MRNNDLEPVSIEVPSEISDGGLFCIWSRRDHDEVTIGIAGNNNNAQAWLSANSARILRDSLSDYINQLPEPPK